jgi:hypothetical protein
MEKEDMRLSENVPARKIIIAAAADNLLLITLGFGGEVAVFL